ncbi:MAG TPA: hypothetical protein VF173_06780 [Thermoanaerobaculia bacterium]|nr:hypothetical protein [Thermoanaerobaculia bacterium]
MDTGFNEGGGAALAVDPTDARIVYSGDFRSDDGGTTWAEALSGPDDPRGGKAGIVKLVIDPRQPSTIYGGSFGQVFKSTDRGATWSLAWAGPESLAFLEALVIDPMSGAVFALFADSNGDEVFRSTDGGANWQPVFSRFRIQGMAVDGRLPGRLYVGTRAGGVYRSDDGGSSWVAANHGFRELGFTSVAADPHTPGVLFAVADANPFGILGLTPRIVFRSTDGGATWSSPFGNPESSPYVNEMASDPNQPGTWYLAHASGVLKTQDGGESWENASKGLRFPEFVYTITLAPSQPEKLYALGWDTFPLCEGTDCLKIIVYHSRDGAAQWQGASVPGLAPRFLLTSLAVDAASPSVVYAGGPALFKSSDGGVSWKKSGRGLGGGAFELVTDPSKPGALHAVVARANGHKVFLSRDGSETWEPASRGLPSGVLISKLTPDATTPGTVYAATSRGLYVTRNRGKLWTAMNDGLGDLPVWTVALDPLRPGVVYAGRPDGLFVFSEDPAGH